MLGRTLPLADSNNSSSHIWRKVTTSSRAKVPLVGAVLALDLNAELLNSLGLEVQLVPSRAPLTFGSENGQNMRLRRVLREALRGVTISGTQSAGRLSVLVFFSDAEALGGVDVVLLIATAKKIWFRCALASARILDVSDKHALHTKLACTTFA